MSRSMISGCIAITLLCGGCSGEPRGPVSPTPPAASGPPAAPSPPPIPQPPTSIVDEVTGEYTLTLGMGSGCGIIPASDRTRTYTAAISSTLRDNYVVTLAGGTFLSGGICTFNPLGLDCNQFPAAKQGDEIQFNLVNNNDDGHGGHIVERLSAGTWVELIGEATGRLNGSIIEANGRISVWYCPTSLGYPFPCFTHTGCSSDDLRLTFTRR